MLATGVASGAESGATGEEAARMAAWIRATADPNAAIILGKVKAAYKGMESFSATGQAVTKTEVEDPNTHKSWQAVTKTDFAVKLARPSLYLVEWNQRKWIEPEPLLSAVYGDGKRDFLVTNGTKTPQPDRMAALSAATGMSEGAASVMPAMFFDGQLGNIEGPGMTRMCDETVEGRMCYVLKREMAPRGSQTWVWIVQDTYLVKRYETTVTPIPGIPVSWLHDAEANDEDIKAHLRAGGVNPDVGAIYSYRTNLRRETPMSLAGTVRTMQTYDDMKVDPAIKESEFVPVRALEATGEKAAGGTGTKSQDQ
jgi:hypothetical protein